MPASARKGDSIATGHACTGSSNIDTPGQSKVSAQGKLCARATDPIVVHTIKVGDACVPHGVVVNAGSSKVSIANLPAARIGDSADAGAVTGGSNKVFMGG